MKKGIKSKKGKKAMMIIAVIIGGLLSINFIGFILNMTMFRNELEGIQPYGELVEVDGRNLHIHAMGSGEETIVLLSGWGVPLPSADFGPLMRKLSENYTAVTVEYFGVGFSDETDTPRTNENYMNEIRTALKKGGFQPPYILMPHSISGIYSEYYAIKHPEEVSAIVMLDTTSTAKIEETSKLLLNATYSAMKFSQVTGMMRINSRLISTTKSIENGYTEQEKADYRLFYNHVVNDTIINQSLLSMDNVKEVNALTFPQGVPVLKIIAEETVKGEGMEYQQEHLSRLGENVDYKVLDGTHFIYETQVDEISRLVDELLANTHN